MGRYTNIPDKQKQTISIIFVFNKTEKELPWTSAGYQLPLLP